MPPLCRLPCWTWGASFKTVGDLEAVATLDQETTRQNQQGPRRAVTLFPRYNLAANIASESKGKRFASRRLSEFHTDRENKIACPDTTQPDLRCISDRKSSPPLQYKKELMSSNLYLLHPTTSSQTHSITITLHPFPFQNAAPVYPPFPGPRVRGGLVPARGPCQPLRPRS